MDRFSCALTPDYCCTDVQRLRHVLETAATKDETALRLTVEAGGCSGFSYKCVASPLTTQSIRPTGILEMCSNLEQSLTDWWGRGSMPAYLVAAQVCMC